MSNVRFALVAGALAALALACGDAPKVVQGTVESYDPQARILVVRNERPAGGELQLSLAGSEVGADPQVGDVVRAAYRAEGGRLRATRVMNLTRQAEVGLRKSDGGR
jgi:hypothetical protein